MGEKPSKIVYAPAINCYREFVSLHEKALVAQSECVFDGGPKYARHTPDGGVEYARCVVQICETAKYYPLWHLARTPLQSPADLVSPSDNAIIDDALMETASGAPRRPATTSTWLPTTATVGRIYAITSDGDVVLCSKATSLIGSFGFKSWQPPIGKEKNLRTALPHSWADIHSLESWCMAAHPELWPTRLYKKTRAITDRCDS